MALPYYTKFNGTKFGINHYFTNSYVGQGIQEFGQARLVEDSL